MNDIDEEVLGYLFSIGYTVEDILAELEIIGNLSKEQVMEMFK